MLDKNKIYNFDKLSSTGMVMLLVYLYKPNSKYNFTYATLDLVRKNNGVLYFDKDLNDWNWTEYTKDKNIEYLNEFNL